MSKVPMEDRPAMLLGVSGPLVEQYLTERPGPHLIPLRGISRVTGPMMNKIIISTDMIEASGLSQRTMSRKRRDKENGVRWSEKVAAALLFFAGATDGPQYN
ncbi:hypothetical protein J6590_048160 [Homalodisca vitripennis]|nr:hypothetical protein J6590_048160 [Homalodisca vitripennis]